MFSQSQTTNFNNNTFNDIQKQQNYAIEQIKSNRLDFVTSFNAIQFTRKTLDLLPANWWTRVETQQVLDNAVQIVLFFTSNRQPSKVFLNEIAKLDHQYRFLLAARGLYQSSSPLLHILSNSNAVNRSNITPHNGFNYTQCAVQQNPGVPTPGQYYQGTHGLPYAPARSQVETAAHSLIPHQILNVLSENLPSNSQYHREVATPSAISNNSCFEFEDFTTISQPLAIKSISREISNFPVPDNIFQQSAIQTTNDSNCEKEIFHSQQISYESELKFPNKSREQLHNISEDNKLTILEQLDEIWKNFEVSEEEIFSDCEPSCESYEINHHELTEEISSSSDIKFSIESEEREQYELGLQINHSLSNFAGDEESDSSLFQLKDNFPDLDIKTIQESHNKPDNDVPETLEQYFLLWRRLGKTLDLLIFFWTRVDLVFSLAKSSILRQNFNHQKFRFDGRKFKYKLISHFIS
jgi:hypothetical protein